MTDGQESSANHGLRPAVPDPPGPQAEPAPPPQTEPDQPQTDAAHAEVGPDLPGVAASDGAGSSTDEASTLVRPGVPGEAVETAVAAEAVATERRRVGGAFRHPIAAGRAAGRTTVAWARRPSGRVIIPGVLALLLVGGAGAAGAYLVPQSIDALPSASAAPGQPPPWGGVPSGAVGAPGPGDVPGGLTAPPGSFGPVTPGTGGPAQGGAPRTRPADALAVWAQQVAARVGIPVVAAQAYGYAELVLNRTAPGCKLSWTTLAALAKVESDHGSANGAVLGEDGVALPSIIGLPLDGKGGRQLIRDTDQGALDGDTVYDRAVGPLQFIPSTWRQYAVDADNNGVSDPNDIDDAAMTAGTYLCRDGHDLSKADDWWNAILSYNNVQPYAQQVFAEANNYGQRSRT